MTHTVLDRRRFLQGIGGAAALTAGGAALSGCASGNSHHVSSNDKQVALPAYAPQDAVDLDLPASDDGTPGGILRYPGSPRKMYDAPPAKGGSVTVLKMIDNAPPPSVGKNAYWQKLNERLGTDLKLTNIAADYPAKLATTLAGGDLPDIVQMETSVPHLPDVLAKDFQDLSEWISGDAVKNYVGLPGLLEISWQNVVFNGGIWGIPWQLGPAAAVLEIRQDLVDAKGLSTNLSSGQDFLDLCGALTDPDKHTWAIGTPSTALNIVREMVGVPNTWREVKGKFTSMYETDEYKQALDIVASIFKKGYIYPDSITSAAGVSQWFGAGKVAMSAGGYTNWSLYVTANTPDNPDFKMGGIVPPKWDGGGQAAHWTGNGMYTFTAIKKAGKSRVEELLRILDWFAAPFGSEEYTFRRYGVPGRDYTVSSGEPTVTNTGTSEVQNMNVGYIATCPLLLYVPGQPDATKAEHEFLSKLMQVTVQNATIGLFSDTALTKGATIETNIINLQNDIISGHESLSAWSDGVSSWRSGGGDQIRHEYEEAFAQKR